MPQRMAAADRRKQLLATAASCFAEHGYRGTTTAMLARRANVTEPILYRHFPTKHDLFIALIEAVADEILEAWQALIADVTSPLDRIKALLYRNPATVDPRTRGIYRIIFHASTEFSEPKILAAIRAHYQQYLVFFSQIVREAQLAGQVRTDVDAEYLAWQIIHAAVGFAMVRPLEIPGHATPESVQTTVELLLEMLAGPGKQPRRSRSLQGRSARTSRRGAAAKPAAKTR